MKVCLLFVNNQRNSKETKEQTFCFVYVAVAVVFRWGLILQVLARQEAHFKI